MCGSRNNSQYAAFLNVDFLYLIWLVIIIYANINTANESQLSPNFIENPNMVIANGKDPLVLYDIVDGKDVGTRFLAERKNWW